MSDASQALALRAGSIEVLLGLLVAVTIALLRPRRAVGDDRALPRLEIRVEENGTKRTLRLGVPITIGRSEDAQVHVKDLHASRLHAIIDLEDGLPFVEDLESRNGTRVNARPIAGRAVIAPGDDIRVGRARIVYCGEVPWT